MARSHRIFFLLLFTVLIPKVEASHLRAGEITARRIGCTSLTYEITITVYIDTESGVQFGGEILDLGDETRITLPDVITQPRPDLGENMGVASFTVYHTYTSMRNYTIRYSEQFRNAGVVNMDNSDATNFYLETTIYMDIVDRCNSSLPELLVPPIDRGCVGVAFFHNPGAFDRDGDSLSYELAIPRHSITEEVFNYHDPDDRKFYRDFNAGNESKNGQPDFSINPLDGTLVWDAPGTVGEYNVAFKIIEWRKDDTGQWQRLSHIVRDMQIIIEDCMNTRPELLLPADTCVVAGTLIDKSIFGTDKDNDAVKIEIFSEVMKTQFPATFEPDPAIFQPSQPIARSQFKWQTHCAHVKEQPYRIVFKITDKPDTGPMLVTFRTWTITVVAPEPTWKNATLITNRYAKLDWDEYACSNAKFMQVWRKIGSTDYDPANCDTGMPSGLGYTLIKTLKLQDDNTGSVISSFIDTNNDEGLAPGAQYCYRLVAVFPDPKGGESYVSKDTCLAPLPADAPVITHVTVDKTDEFEGAITVSWYSPFQIDKSLYPGPYQYAIYRGEGVRSSSLTRVTQQTISDTTFTDTNLDTENKVYNYQIVLFSKTTADPVKYVAIDTSAIASSVRVEAEVDSRSITLNWKAEVPWSNSSLIFPYHKIYRGEEGMDEQNFVLIDSIQSLTSSFKYTDTGKYLNKPLEKDKVYCYRVTTYGTYNNNMIIDPLINYSQNICAKLSDQDKPCAPTTSLYATNCEDVFASSQCSVSEFSNRLAWSDACFKRGNKYNVYAATGADQKFVLIAENVRDTFYIDGNLPSFARCYRVSSVDRYGVESELSETVCNDNCPYFALPNVFTPNDDQCNDFFSAYGALNPILANANESCSTGYENYTQCIRFVRKVAFKVFNRWGKEVYTLRDVTGENNQYINWDGTNNQGDELGSGVYYYIAEVTFDTLDPSSRQKTFKGWVHLVR